MPIVVTLDLHANVTAAMASNVEAIIGYRTWPHIDHFETGQAGAEKLMRILAGEIRPACVMHKLPMIVPAENMHTSRDPMAGIFAIGEQFGWKVPAVLSTSVFGVQPWMDVVEMGCSTVCVVDGGPAGQGRNAPRPWRGSSGGAPRNSIRIFSRRPRRSITYAIDSHYHDQVDDGITRPFRYSEGFFTSRRAMAWESNWIRIRWKISSPVQGAGRGERVLRQPAARLGAGASGILVKTYLGVGAALLPVATWPAVILLNRPGPLSSACRHSLLGR